MWNFVGDIIGTNADGMEIYQDFVQGRAQAFHTCMGDGTAQLPAATGIGTQGRGIAFQLLAARAELPRHLENGRQTSAYHYPGQYGPKPPSSARATLASATGQGLLPDPDAVRAVWEDAVAAPEWAGPAVWLHGDLHPANVLTADGTFCGVIDFGDRCAGDPACDLGAPWVLLPDGAADRFYEAYQPCPEAATLRRARGWAVLRALSGILIGEAGVRGRPGGKTTWGPPAQAALRRLVEAGRR